MKLKHVLFTTIALAAFSGEAVANHEYKVVRVDLPNGSPIFALRRVEHPATIAVYSRDQRAYRKVDRPRTHEEERVSQMQVGNSSPVTLRGRAH
jgi:hypothetical protein